MKEATLNDFMGKARESAPTVEMKMCPPTDVTTYGQIEESVLSSSANSLTSSSCERAGESQDADSNEDGNEQDEIVFGQLAKQLEYYFSTTNLANDTYLETLRGLNDGCVPATILARFGKVKAILHNVFEEEKRVHAILRAATGFSELLEVHRIDTSRGKRLGVEDSVSSGLTIPAIGPVTLEPLATEDLSLAPTSPSTVANTIILRDVPSHVTSEEVRDLFEFEHCPPVVNVQKEFGGYWFVTLDTDDRTEMVNALMRIQTMSLGGETILARIKASTAPMYDPAACSSVQLMMLNTIGSAKKKKKRVRGKKKKKSDMNAKNSSAALKEGAAVTSKKEKTPHPPSMSETNFPTLQDKKVEWETPPVERSYSIKSASNSTIDDEEELMKSAGKVVSDGASTATTASSSTDSAPKKVLGGYAAAVLKSVPEPAPAPKKIEDAKTWTPPAHSKQVFHEAVPSVEVREATVVKLPVWGKGRSFADVVKDEIPVSTTQPV